MARRAVMTRGMVVQQRLNSTEAPKKFSKWKLLKNGVKYGLIAAVGYGAYSKLFGCT